MLHPVKATVSDSDSDPSPSDIDVVIRGPTRRVLTLMFTDIENSTWLWEQHGDDMEAAVVGHNALVSSLVDAAGGRVLRFMGDGVLAVFVDACPALAAAIDIQRAFTSRIWPKIGELRLRIGLNTGVCRVEGGELFGRPPNLAARLESAAHGGQILLSEATAQAARPRLRPGEQLFELGRYHIRGFAEPTVIHSLLADGLPSVFPPLRTPYLGFDDLPSDGSPLYGRDALVAEVAALLAGHRLVTLWGPGGVGKTRVALRVAGQARRPYEHGVRFIDLAGLDRPSLVAPAVAAAVRAQPRAGETELDTVLRVLRYARLLLVLDNCEGVLEGVRALVTALGALDAVAHVLATSREALGARDEQVIEVPPLGVPGLGDAVDRVTASDAVRLFVDRARLQDPHFAVTEQNVGLVAGLCRALDGLPFALELAAARLGIEPLDRLAGGLGALASEQDQPARPPWSLAALTADEQDLFQRLAVFSGAFPPDLAVRAAADPSRAQHSFDRLVHTSMVVRDVTAPDRFRVLAVAREHGWATLDESGRQAVRSRHAQLMLERAETSGPQLRGSEERQAAQALRADWPDHRAAFQSFAERDAVDDAARLVVALFQFGLFQPQPEVYGWAEWAAERVDAAQPHAAEVFGAAALGAWFAGDSERAIARGTRAVDVADRYGGSTVWARTALVNALGYTGRMEEGEKHFLALVRDLRASSEVFWQVNGLGYEAVGLSLFGALDEAAQRAERALALARRLDNPDCLQWALYALGRVLAATDPASAATAFEEAMAAAREVESRFNIGLALVEWVGLQRRLGDLRSAIAGTLDLLDMLAVSGNRSQLSQVLRQAGMVLADAGHDEAGALVLLARQGLPEMPAPPDEALADETRLADLRRTLGERWSTVGLRAKATAEPALISLCRTQLSDLLQATADQ
jgi:predicted ATPase/class 3 adenylate cyclase